MKIVKVQRRIGFERNQSQKMGEIITRTTEVKKYLFGLPIKTLHKRSRRFHGHLTAGYEKNLFI